MELLETYHFDCIAPDQDYLNEMGEGNILHLDPRWDAMPNENTEPIKILVWSTTIFSSNHGISKACNMKIISGKALRKPSFTTN